MGTETATLATPAETSQAIIDRAIEIFENQPEGGHEHGLSIIIYDDDGNKHECYCMIGAMIKARFPEFEPHSNYGEHPFSEHDLAKTSAGAEAVDKVYNALPEEAKKEIRKAGYNPVIAVKKCYRIEDYNDHLYKVNPSGRRKKAECLSVFRRASENETPATNA